MAFGGGVAYPSQQTTIRLPTLNLRSSLLVIWPSVLRRRGDLLGLLCAVNLAPGLGLLRSPEWADSVLKSSELATVAGNGAGVVSMMQRRVYT